MAYFSTSGTAASSADFLVRLKDFLVATCGWTLHDDGSATANPYYVLRSFGESGAEDIYLQLVNDSGTDRISVHAFLYWDAAAHTGVKEAYYNSQSYLRTVDASAFFYWFYADLDHFFVVTKVVATYYGQYSGAIKRFWSGAVALTQEPASAGSNVTLPVSDASLFTPGRPYLIRDNANIERVVVSSIETAASPPTVTLASLAAPYAAGAKLGEDPQPVMVSVYNAPGIMYALNRMDGWSGASGQQYGCGAANGGFNTAANPDSRYGFITLFPWLVGSTTAGSKEIRGELIELFSIGSGAADSEDTIDLGGDVYKIFNLSSAGWCAVKE